MSGIGMNCRLPIGYQATVGGITLRSNGRVDAAEGTIPKGGLETIQDERIEAFIATPSLESLGSDVWGSLRYNPSRHTTIAGCVDMESTEVGKPRQYVELDPEAQTVTLVTIGGRHEGFFNHMIGASFDSTGAIDPKTITEWVNL